MSDAMMEALGPVGAVTMMTASGARGNKGNIGQLGAMRGLMADPSGRIIDVPVRSNFREGMTVLEYFIPPTAPARASPTPPSARPTPGTSPGAWWTWRRTSSPARRTAGPKRAAGSPGPSPTRSSHEGRVPAPARRPPGGGRSRLGRKARRRARRSVDRNDDDHRGDRRAIDEAGIDEVLVRSPLTCEARYGVCRTCYGRNLATGDLVGIGEAVGIIAAQSIGEPGTQLTMRTFHTGGVAGLDITAGLPRVEELFEARVPKGKAEISHIDGVVEIIRGDAGRGQGRQPRGYDTSIQLPAERRAARRRRRSREANQVLARVEAGRPATRRHRSRVSWPGTSDGLVVRAEDVVEREYPSRTTRSSRSRTARRSAPATPITDGPINPQEYLDTRGKDAVQRYLVKEVQKVYRSQGVTINDKHIEIIVRQMLRKVRIDQPGDSELLPTELIDRLDFEEVNNRVLAEGGEPATAQTVLLGVTKASLNTS